MSTPMTWSVSECVISAMNERSYITIRIGLSYFNCPRCRAVPQIEDIRRVCHRRKDKSSIENDVKNAVLMFQSVNLALFNHKSEPSGADPRVCTPHRQVQDECCDQPSVSEILDREW